MVKKMLGICAMICACLSLRAISGDEVIGGSGTNCVYTCEGIVDFFTHVTPAPANGDYPHYAFIQADGNCKRLWQVDSISTKVSSGLTTTKHYASVPDDKPKCKPQPAEQSALITSVSIVTAPGQTWGTLCYESCVVPQ